MVPFFKLAFSGALSMSAEIWSYEIATILAGLLGTVELNAHTITLTLATFIFYSFPFANGIAASIRVGQWMGDGNYLNAQRSSQVSFLLSLAVQFSLVSIVFPCRHDIGELFTSDQEVADTVSTLVPIMCVFMLGDSLQATVGGVMRGLGQQKLMLRLNILAYWVLALPIGSLLMFVGHAGLHGMWWAFVLAVFSSGTVGLMTLKYGMSWEKEAMKAAKRVTALPLTSTHTPRRIPPDNLVSDGSETYSFQFDSSLSTGGGGDEEESCADSVVFEA
jgi:MATE family multidrug resistance protein